MSDQSHAHSPELFQWSKECVGHLRTVHLSLIALSAGLLVLVLTADSYNPRRALVQVQEILDLKKRWSSNWIRASRKPPSPQDQFGPEADTDGKEQAEALLPFVPEMYVRISDDKHTNRLIQQVVKVRLQPDWIADKQWQNSNEFAGDFPAENVLEMKRWWTRMMRPRRAAVAEAFLSSCEAFDYSEDPDDPNPLVCSIVTTAVRGGTREINQNYPLPVDGETILRPYIQLIPSPSDRASFKFNLRTALWFSGNIKKIFIRVYNSFSSLTVDQSLLTERYTDWRAGDFDASFRDLVEATRGMGTVSLEKVEAHLSDEVSKGGTTFEAFGLKIQASQITTAGTLLLITVQLYVFLFLRQLPPQLSVSDSGWAEPWIAFDISPVGRFCLAVTFALPAIAVTLLRLFAIRAGGTESGSALMNWTFLTLAVLGSACLAVGSWVYRPYRGEARTELRPRQ